MRADELFVPARMILVMVRSEKVLAELEPSLLGGGGPKPCGVVRIDNGVRTGRLDRKSVV